MDVFFATIYAEKEAAGVEQKVNWDEIRNEYIQGGISYRALAAKYGVSVRTLGDRAKAEKWVELRRQVRDKTVTKTIEAIARENARANKRINHLANQLMDKLEKAVGELDKKTISMKSTLKTAQSEVTSEYRKVDMTAEAPVDRAGIRQLTASLKDLKAILDVQSDMDAREQEARIEKLRRDARDEGNQARMVTVQLEGELNDFAE